MPSDAPAEDPVPGPSDAGTGREGPRPARSGGVRSRKARPKREYSAGGVVMRRIGGSVHVLLIRDPYRKWGLPKGHVEAGEGTGEAALREVREETGLRHLELGPALGTIDWFFRLDGRLVHKFCTFFAMRSARGTAVPETGEGITACAWVAAPEAADRIAYENARTVVREAVRRLDQDRLPF